MEGHVVDRMMIKSLHSFGSSTAENHVDLDRDLDMASGYHTTYSHSIETHAVTGEVVFSRSRTYTC